MISIVENKDFIVTKIVDIVRNNPKISQKEVVSSVTTIFDNVSEEDTKLILQMLNTLVQNKVIKRINKGRKVTYTFNDFTNDSDENSINFYYDFLEYNVPFTSPSCPRDLLFKFTRIWLWYA